MGRCSSPFESTYANCVERSFSRSLVLSSAMVHLLVPAGIDACPVAEFGPSAPPSRSHRAIRQRVRQAPHLIAGPLRSTGQNAAAGPLQRRGSATVHRPVGVAMPTGL